MDPLRAPVERSTDLHGCETVLEDVRIVVSGPFKRDVLDLGVIYGLRDGFMEPCMGLRFIDDRRCCRVLLGLVEFGAHNLQFPNETCRS